MLGLADKDLKQLLKIYSGYQKKSCWGFTRNYNNNEYANKNFQWKDTNNFLKDPVKILELKGTITEMKSYIERLKSRFVNPYKKELPNLKKA